jgi:hypothetical protein
MTFGDLVAFSWYHKTRSARSIGFVLILSALVSWSACRNLPDGHGTFVVVLTWFVMTAILFSFIFVLGFLVSVLMAISKKNTTFLTDNTIELTDDGIMCESRYGRSELVWDVVQKLRRTKHFILIYTAQAKAFVIPRRAFQGDQEWNMFYEILESHHRGEGEKLVN